MKLEFYQPRNGDSVANAHVQDALLAQFGGFTAIPAQGAYKRQDGSIDREPVEVLTVYANAEVGDTQAFFERLAARYGEEADQEAVLFVINDVPVMVVCKSSAEQLARSKDCARA